jgi:hypothetical protein
MKKNNKKKNIGMILDRLYHSGKKKRKENVETEYLDNTVNRQIFREPHKNI